MIEQQKQSQAASIEGSLSVRQSAEQRVRVPPIEKAHHRRAGDGPDQTPGRYLSSARKGGGVEQDWTRTQTIPEISGWRTRPNFLAKFFLGKNF
jgi:hypothetical protein